MVSADFFFGGGMNEKLTFIIIMIIIDIVCLVFLEDNAIFDPKAIRSKFLHVYIVVRLETISDRHRWR